jgi:hypothetical protein
LAATETGSRNYFGTKNRKKGDFNVGSAMSKSGMVENMEVAVEIASPSLSVQKLFPLPVCVVDVRVPDAGSLCRTTSGRVVSRISESGVAGNVGVAVEIASPSLSVQKLFLLPVCVVGIRVLDAGSRCRPTSDRVVSGISESDMAENVGVAVEIASPSLFVQKLFPLPVSSLPF